MNTNKFLEMMEKRAEEQAARQSAAEENKDVPMAATEDEPMAAASEGTGAVMINTGGGGVKIGSSDPNVQKMVEEITDEDEKRGVLAFLKQ